MEEEKKGSSLLQDAVGASSLYGLLEELDEFMHKKFIWAVTPKDTASGAGNPWPADCWKLMEVPQGCDAMCLLCS